MFGNRYVLMLAFSIVCAPSNVFMHTSFEQELFRLLEQAHLTCVWLQGKILAADLALPYSSRRLRRQISPEVAHKWAK